MKQETQLKKWVENQDIDLNDMYDMCQENEWTDYIATTQDSLRHHICECVNNGYACADLLKSVEDNTMAEFFAVDLSCWSDAKPIYTKQDLADAILGLL